MLNLKINEIFRISSHNLKKTFELCQMQIK